MLNNNVQLLYKVLSKFTINDDHGSTRMQHVYHVNTITALFSSQSDAPFIMSWLFVYSSVTERTSDDQHLGSLHSLDDRVFVAKLSKASLLLPCTSVHRENMWNVNSELLLAYYFTASVQRILKDDEIQNISTDCFDIRITPHF